MTKKFCCNECGKDNIQFQVWADENNNIMEGERESTDWMLTLVWCEDCQKPTRCKVKHGI